MLETPAISIWLYRNVHTPFADDASRGRDRALLEPSELQRLASLQSKKRQHEYLDGHILLRSALNHRVPGWAAQNRVIHAEHSAPRLVGPLESSISFSLSHSQSNICCAVGLNCELGIDIEQQGRTRPFDEIADNYFSEDEARTLAAMPAAEKAAEFYRLWTLKESLMKAEQSGLNINTMKTAFIPISDPRTSLGMHLDAETINDKATYDKERNKRHTWYSYYIKLDALHISLCTSRPIDTALQINLYQPDAAITGTVNVAANENIAENTDANRSRIDLLATAYLPSHSHHHSQAAQQEDC